MSARAAAANAPAPVSSSSAPNVCGDLCLQVVILGRGLRLHDDGRNSDLRRVSAATADGAGFTLSAAAVAAILFLRGQFPSCFHAANMAARRGVLDSGWWGGKVLDA